MKKTTLLLISIFLFISCTDKLSIKSEIPIIPIPYEVKNNKNNFTWDNATSIKISESNNDLEQCSQYFQQLLNKSSKSPIKIIAPNEADDNCIILSLSDDIDGDEAYILEVTNKSIEIKGKTGKGVFYGIQTLLQMMPAMVYEANGLPETFEIQGAMINDKPQFPYRGMHLDVSRNFMTTNEVKKYIDLISMFKFNTFHWHLTDGAGWRIEIKKYPLLTKKTAFRAQQTWKEFWFEGGRKFVDEGTPNSYGGYYTQDEIKDIVAYAKERYITIIPEIEMPAHSEEVFVAYPNLSCSNIPYKDSDFCAGNDESFEFIENVLDEVMALFPSEYIHIGGDEAEKSAWKSCPKCQKRMKDENLKDLNELQSYFIKRVSEYLTKNKRKLIGWDEIIDGGLPTDATVMLWRDPETAIKAANMGHDIIMTPGRFCYFDSYQDDPTTEPEAIGGYLPLSKVYGFDLIPNDSVASKFKGGQANIWTEYIPNFKQVEYMAFPRAIALSEVLWSDKKNRNWESFKKRLNNQLPRLDYLAVNYHKPSFELNLTQTIDTINKIVKVTFDTEQSNPEIRYTLDGSIPNNNSPLYKDTIIIKNSKTLNASIFINGEPQKLFSKDLGFHKAVGKKVIYNNKWESYPAGGETALTDAKLGGYTYSDDLWQGFTTNLDVIIDLEEETELNYFASNFMQLIGPGVYMPEYVEVFGSNDGMNFKLILKVENDVSRKYERLIFKNFSGSLKGDKYRYVKVFAKNNGGFIFTDEIILN